MAWFPCNIGSGSAKDGDGVLILGNGQISDTSQYLYPTYTDLSIYKTAVARVTMDRGGTEFVGYGMIDCTNLPSNITVTLYSPEQSRVSINITFSNTSITQVSYSGSYYNTYLDIEAFDFGYAPKPKIKQGTFVSASSQFGIVDVDCGFKPDMVMVRLPFGNNDTTSYWEKGMSWAETKSLWNLYPAESIVYVVDLDRQSGEAGIQAINNNGFSFMSNGGNTQGVTCEYIAIKYETEPTLEPDTSNLLFKDGKFYNTDKVELGIENGVVSDGTILFTTSSAVGGIYFNSSTLDGKFAIVIHYENDNQSVQVRMQYGTSKVGTSVVNVINSGTDRYTYASKSVNKGVNDLVTVLKETDGDDTIGAFFGNQSANATWKIYEIYLIQY